LQGEIDGGRAESAVATAGLVLGLTGLAGGAVSWWLGSRAEAAPQVTARLAPTPGGLVVSGTFR
jgi:Na+/glutamate symporter